MLALDGAMRLRLRCVARLLMVTAEQLQAEKCRKYAQMHNFNAGPRQVGHKPKRQRTGRPLKTLGSGGEAPPRRAKSEDLPLKTLGSGGEAPPSRPKSEDLPLKTLGSGEPDRAPDRAGSADASCPDPPVVDSVSFLLNHY